MSVTNAEAIYQLEQQLQNSLRRVQPDPQFVQQLQYRLANPGPTLSAPRTAGVGLLLTALGIAGGVLLLWLLGRLNRE
ncbi:MAG: hypothetical protein JW987_00375 [Anaerolineaceae bacterium]|nr:hypothetical protein [Anaerolineaceae bacterium]